MNEITYSPIGTVHSDYKSKDGMPIQSAFADGSRGTVEIKKEYIDALLGLDEESGGDIANIINLNKIITRWLVNHILKIDLEMIKSFNIRN